MIKLFWNTHNQIKPKTITEKGKDSLNYIWGLYHQKNSDKWIYDVLKKINFKSIKSEKDLEGGDTLIIIDSNIKNKNELYLKLKLICSKMFLIHLGDESGSDGLNPVYDNFNYVWRAFCSNKYFKNEHVSCLPIGYKSGIFNHKVKKRHYKWSFIGTPHKSSRHDLLFQFSNIEPSFCHKTQKFNEKIISVEKMSEVLSSTEFVPCPNGFVHPETYRLYEALECGCIPIVESAYNYYDRLFPNNPFLKINKWQDANSYLKEWDNEKIKNKLKACEDWWNEYKNNIQEFIKNKINL